MLPKIFIQAEAHSVWQTNDGDLKDVTPSGDDDRESLVLLDPTMKQLPGYDFIPSLRVNVCGDRIVDDYIEAVSVADKIEDEIYIGKRSNFYGITERQKAYHLRKKVVELFHSYK